MLCIDIELNPCPRLYSGQSFLICHWKLNSIVAQNFPKIPFLKECHAIYNCDLTCLSETYLNHDTLFDGGNLYILGYKLIWIDHPLNKKPSSIFVYHKDFLSIQVNNVSYLRECSNFNLSVNERQCNIPLINCSPSQSSNEFYTFSTNFEFLLDKIAN